MEDVCIIFRQDYCLGYKESESKITALYHKELFMNDIMFFRTSPSLYPLSRGLIHELVNDIAIKIFSSGLNPTGIFFGQGIIFYVVVGLAFPYLVIIVICYLMPQPLHPHFF